MSSKWIGETDAAGNHVYNLKLDNFDGPENAATIWQDSHSGAWLYSCPLLDIEVGIATTEAWETGATLAVQDIIYQYLKEHEKSYPELVEEFEESRKYWENIRKKRIFPRNGWS